jgi:hypothetical protein
MKNQELQVTMAVEQPDIIKAMHENLAAAAVAHPLPVGDAIDPKPLAGGEINIRIALSPAMMTLLVAPATVGLTMLLGWLMVRTLGRPLYGNEMVGAAIVNVVGGIAASLPLFILMKKGAAAIAQAGILGIALRCSTVLMGVLIAGAPAWGLDRMPLIYWLMAFYFPLLMAETAIVAWLSNKARH